MNHLGGLLSLRPVGCILRQSHDLFSQQVTMKGWEKGTQKRRGRTVEGTEGKKNLPAVVVAAERLWPPVPLQPLGQPEQQPEPPPATCAAQAPSA